VSVLVVVAWRPTSSVTRTPIGCGPAPRKEVKLATHGRHDGQASSLLRALLRLAAWSILSLNLRVRSMNQEEAP